MIIDFKNDQGEVFMRLEIPEKIPVKWATAEDAKRADEAQAEQRNERGATYSSAPVPMKRREEPEAGPTFAWNPAATMVQPAIVKCPNDLPFSGQSICREIGQHTHYADGGVFNITDTLEGAKIRGSD